MLVETILTEYYLMIINEVLYLFVGAIP